MGLAAQIWNATQNPGADFTAADSGASLQRYGVSAVEVCDS
jgi:hypothetical protein